METNRRGFLKGLAGLVASPLLLSALPIGTAGASPSSEPLIWTPEGSTPLTVENIPMDLRQPNGRMIHRLSGPVSASRFLTVTVQDEHGNKILSYGVAQNQGLYWKIDPAEPLISGDRMMLDLAISTRPR